MGFLMGKNVRVENSSLVKYGWLILIYQMFITIAIQIEVHLNILFR